MAEEMARLVQPEFKADFVPWVRVITTRARNVLWMSKIFDIKSLLAIHPSDLFGLKNCGRKTAIELQELQQKLADLQAQKSENAS